MLHKDKLGDMGFCPLCGPDSEDPVQLKELKKSHHLTKSTYKYFDSVKAQGTKLLVKGPGSGQVFPLGKQVIRYLLCSECELLMSVRGEKYFAESVLKFDLGKKTPPHVYVVLKNTILNAWVDAYNCTEGRVELIMDFPGSAFSSINSMSIYHYAVGYFWKATFKGWLHCDELCLGDAFVEKMRKYILGGSYVDGYILRVVPSFWLARYATVFPMKSGEDLFFSNMQFDFYFEHSPATYDKLMRAGSLPVIYSVDRRKSERVFKTLKARYQQSKKAKAIEGSELSWFDQPTVYE